MGMAHFRTSTPKSKSLASHNYVSAVHDITSHTADSNPENSSPVFVRGNTPQYNWNSQNPSTSISSKHTWGKQEHTYIQPHQQGW